VINKDKRIKVNKINKVKIKSKKSMINDFYELLNKKDFHFF